ncbi:hypothetical protein LC612_37530, partial [Nostoc sp. CHAB 5834]|nr:hypothetical protein [Nostoc sp. CHAB 5834]
MVVPPKTPGVYIVEKNAFPNSVVEVATAIPVFIGYTESASHKGQTMKGKPVRITSLQEYNTIFGRGHVPTFTLLPNPSAPVTAPLPDTITVGELSFTSDKKPFYLYNSLKLFYQNGGATCYIISAGLYGDHAAPAPKIFSDAIDTLAFEQEPTLILCPDAHRLGTIEEYNKVMTSVLRRCALDQSRMAIMDVYDSAILDRTALDTAIGAFRGGVGQNNLNYGVAYFPWVKASIVSTNDVDFTCLGGALLDSIKTKLGT